jgi:predicted nucleic acid-binding protein
MIAVDTNVLVYAVDHFEPVKMHKAAALLLSLKNSSLVVPWQVAVEFLARLRHWERIGRLSRTETDKYLNQFVLSVPIVYPTSVSLTQSLALSSVHSLSHWDSLLIAACNEAGITTLYSEDLSHNMTYGTVTVLNPF